MPSMVPPAIRFRSTPPARIPLQLQVSHEPTGATPEVMRERSRSFTVADTPSWIWWALAAAAVGFLAYTYWRE